MVKAYKEQTFADLARNNLGFLVRDKPADIVEAQEQAYNYIILQSREFGVDPMNVRAMEIFDVGTGKDLVTDRGVINKRLMALMTAGPNVIADSDRLSGVSAAVCEAFKTDHTQEIATCEKSAVAKLTQADNYFSAANADLEAAARHNDRARELRKIVERGDVDDLIYREFSAIEGTGHFKYLGTDTVGEIEYFYFGLTSPCLLSHVNSSHNIEVRDYNFGYYGLAVSKQKVRGFSGPYTINVRSASHPHMNARTKNNHHRMHFGDICWGNMASTAAAHIKNREYSKLASLYHALMNSYSEENPYVSFGNYVEHATNTQIHRCSLSPELEALWAPVAPVYPNPETMHVYEAQKVLPLIKIGDIVQIVSQDITHCASVGCIGIVVKMRGGQLSSEGYTDSNAYYLRVFTEVELDNNRMKDRRTSEPYTHRSEIRKIDDVAAEFINAHNANQNGEATREQLLLIENYSRVFTSRYFDRLARIDYLTFGKRVDIRGNTGSSSFTRLYAGSRYVKVESSKIADEYVRNHVDRGSSNSISSNVNSVDRSRVAVHHSLFGTTEAANAYYREIGARATLHDSSTTAFLCPDCQTSYDDYSSAHECCYSERDIEEETTDGPRLDWGS